MSMAAPGKQRNDDRVRSSQLILTLNIKTYAACKVTKNHKGTKTLREPIPVAVERVAKQVVDASFTMHSALGAGLLESVYEVCLAYELTKRGLKAERQLALPVVYDNVHLEAGFRLD